MTIINGGVGCLEPVGNTHKDQEVIILVKKTFLSFISVGSTLLHIVNGQEKDFPLKLNGNMLREVVFLITFTPGEMNMSVRVQ